MGRPLPSRRAEEDAWLPALLGIALLVATAVYGTRPLVSYRALELGAGTFELGLIVAAYAGLSVLAALPTALGPGND